MKRSAAPPPPPREGSARWGMWFRGAEQAFPSRRGCRNEKKKKLGVSNTLYHGGRWVTDGGWCVTDGGWCVTDGGWCVTDGGWCVTDSGWWVTDGSWCVIDGGWWVTDGGWWVATKHQRVDAIVKKRGGGGERPYGTPCPPETSRTLPLRRGPGPAPLPLDGPGAPRREGTLQSGGPTAAASSAYNTLETTADDRQVVIGGPSLSAVGGYPRHAVNRGR